MLKRIFSLGYKVGGLEKPKCDNKNCNYGGSFGLVRRQVGRKQFCRLECVAANQNGVSTTISTSPRVGEDEVAMEVPQAAD